MLSGRSSSPNYQVQGAWHTAVYSGMTGGWAELPGDTFSRSAHPRNNRLQNQVSQVEQPSPPGEKALQ